MKSNGMKTIEDPMKPAALRREKVAAFALGCLGLLHLVGLALLLLALYSSTPQTRADEQLQAPAKPAGMVLVPAGVYRPLFRGVGEPAAEPVKEFHMDVEPVTNADFLEFVRENPKWRRSQVKRIFAEENYLKPWAGDLELGPGLPARAPVTQVSWFAAKSYAAWKGKRLPTAAEWEYAAGASATAADGRNDAALKRELLAWQSQPVPDPLPVVGLRPPNFFGLRDMHGLVWEWVADFNTALVTGDARGDTGLERQLFCGAGSEGVNDRDNYPAFMRLGFRGSLRADYTVHNLGFRCAKNI